MRYTRKNNRKNTRKNTRKIGGKRRVLKRRMKKGKKCKVKNKAKRYDPGYRDKWRGWYDVQKCGKCHDYCRWVGDSGPGGNPSKRTTRKVKGKGKSWWSCFLADASQGQGTYSSNKKWKKKFKYTRCSKEGIPQWNFKKENWVF